MTTTISVGAKSFVVEPGPHGQFWKSVDRGNWEPETFAIFDKFISEETLFVDVGAWIGSTALYGAQLARRCVAFEPDPVAFRELSRNVALNADADWSARLEIHECAINKDGHSFTLGGSRDGADSMSSALFPDSDSQWTVSARRLQDVLSKSREPGQPVFLKIDIEGSEYGLLPAIREVIEDPQTTIYISFHPHMLRRSMADQHDEDQWQEPYIDQHLAVLDSLPWTRQISLSDGQPVQREALERTLRRRLRFPRELVITGP